VLELVVAEGRADVDGAVAVVVDRGDGEIDVARADFEDLTLVRVRVDVGDGRVGVDGVMLDAASHPRLEHLAFDRLGWCGERTSRDGE
jgi:hypothetical protein